MTADRGSSDRAQHAAADRWNILRRHQEGEPLTVLAEQTGIGLRTLQRWHSQFKKNGPAGLEITPRSDRGARRVHPTLVAVVEGLALTRPRRSIATITRSVGDLALQRGWEPLSYSVVRDIIGNIPADTVTLAQDGQAAYRDRFELAWRHRADRPNTLWQADHTELDILIKAPNGSPIRPWLTVVLDDHSRAVCGYFTFTGAPSAMNTALALRHAIWPKPAAGWPMCGIPDVLYVDHGSDFTSHHLAQAAQDLHFEIIYSTVARPQGRGKIERLFGTINTELLARLPGHLTGGLPPRPQLTLAELDEAIGTFLTTTYLGRIHPEINQTPTSAWIADGWLPRPPETLDQLDGLLLTATKVRIVYRDGIHFQGLRYTATTLAAYVGEPVLIRYDPRDITEIRVFHRSHFLCAAVDPDHAGSTITLKDIQTARAARRRAVRTTINEKIAVVADYLPDLAGRTPAEPRTPPDANPLLLRTYYQDSP